MNTSFIMLVIATLATSAPGAGAPLEPVILAAESEVASSPYVEISELSPAPAKRIIHAHPRNEAQSQHVASRSYDITPIGAVPPTASTLVPASTNTVLQPVEPASTRPYIAPTTSSATIPCPPPASTTTRVSYPTYPAAVNFPTTTSQSQVTLGPPVVSQVALMPVTQNTGMTIGRGSIGQPKLYVEGQPVRNFLRWLTP